MLHTRRSFTLAVGLLLTSLLIFGYVSKLHTVDRWQGISQHVGMGDWISNYRQKHSGADVEDIITTPLQIPFRPGKTKPAGSNYTKTLVVPRRSGERVDWMDKALSPQIARAVYTVDDMKAPLHPPVNKGHEAMVYLTYIVEHYEDLPDVAIFMHAHHDAWHNADVFDLDAGEMIRRLSPERVTREGYMSMRCKWNPGCPDWIHPGETSADHDKKEQVLMARAWAELFPLDPVPKVLATACCSQFAVSKERMESIPKETYLHYRDWLIRTPLDDYVSGRIWEYMWQYIFTGETQFCPVEHICYCDGFGVCFGNEAIYDEWFDTRDKRNEMNIEWLDWERKVRVWNELISVGYSEKELDAMESIDRPEPDMAEVYDSRVEKLQKKMEKMLHEALERGNDPKLRAEEVGRQWHEGDGY